MKAILLATFVLLVGSQFLFVEGECNDETLIIELRSSEPDKTFVGLARLSRTCIVGVL